MKKILLAVTVVGMLGGRATAQSTLYWDGDGAGTQDGGVGTWNTTNARWTTDEGTTYAAWVNANGDSAVFDDVAGVVTVGTVTVQNITFSPTPSAAYSLTGGTITFLAGATITVNTTGTTNTTLSSVYTGTGPITKMGAGRLELNAATNTLSGGYIINQGFINLAASNRLGTGAALPGALDSDWFTFGGGGLTSSNAASQDLGATRGVTLAGKAWFGASATGNPVVVSAPITGTGDIIVANATTTAVNGGSSSPLNTSFNAGGVWILSNAANDWTGDAQIGSGTLRMGASNVIPDTSIVHLTNSGVQFDLATNGTTETVKSVAGTAGTIALGSAGKLTLNNPAGESTASVLTGTVGSQLIKNGAGAITLTGGSSGFSGEVVLNTGTIGVGSTGAFGSNALGPQLTINGGNLSNNSASGRSMSANLSVNLNADFTVDDSLAATQGQILFNGASTIKNSNRTITVNGTGNLAFGSLTAGIGQDVAGRSLTKEGAGTLALLSPVNTYSGSTTINAGTLSVDGDGSLGDGTGTVNLAGGRLNASASRTVAVPNAINVTGDAAITTTSAAATPQFDFSSDSIGGNGTSTLTLRNDGADAASDNLRVRFSGSGFDFANPIDIQNGAVGTTELQSTNSSGTQTFSGVISGNGGYTRQQAGTTILTGANTYSGQTIINSGTVYANNVSGSATGTGAVSVNTTGTLGGFGSVAGAVTVNSGGKVSPGMSIESLDVGSLTFNNGSTFVYEIDSAAGTADLMTSNLVPTVSTGDLNIDTTVDSVVTLDTSDLAGTSVSLAGTTFTLINYEGTWNGGTFAGLPNNSYIIGLGVNDWLITYDSATPGVNNPGGTGMFVTITAAVPEASSLLFGGLACGAASVAYARRWLRGRKA